MKKLITILLLHVSITISATDYYISSSSGNDSNNGISELSPWRTLDKVNAVSLFLLTGGDRVLLKRGDIFYGKIVVKSSGIAENKITYGAYGTGDKPIISGFTNVTNWTNLGGNIWESAIRVSNLPNCNLVTINNMNTPMGRYPNKGWLTYQSFSGNTSITSSALTGKPNWTGAEVVIRKENWVIDRDKITSQTGGSLTYTTTSTYNGKANYGFFIQDDPRTLDVQNEWYYNPANGKLQMYSTSMPTRVKVASIDTLMYINHKDYISVDGLKFEGSNMATLAVISSSNLTIQNCEFDFAGNDCISANRNGSASAPNLVIQDNLINHTNNNAIFTQEQFTNPVVQRNIIKNTGMIPGVSGSGSNGGQGNAIQTYSIGAIIRRNNVDSTAYNGIAFFNNKVTVDSNYVSNFCLVKSDGAGIYTWVGTGSTPFTGQKVLHNIVTKGIGNNDGTSDGELIAHGIYMDDVSADVEVAYNTVSKCAYSGLYVHNASNINIHDNTFYNNALMQVYFASFDRDNKIDNCVFKDNILVAKDRTQKILQLGSRANDLASFGAFDNNIYAKPLSPSSPIVYCSTSTGNIHRSLAQWRAFSGLDRNSSQSPLAIRTLSDLRLEYNPGNSNKTITLEGKYVNLKNQIFKGNIVLAPYTSLVLIKAE